MVVKLEKISGFNGLPKETYRSILQTTLRCCSGNGMVLSGRGKAL